MERKHFTEDMKMVAKKVRCQSCESTQVYTLRNGTVVCRHCGLRNLPKQTKGETK